MRIAVSPSALAFAALLAAAVVGQALAQPTPPSPAAAPPTATAPGAAPARPAAAAQAPQGNGIVAVVNGDIISGADVTARSRLLALNVGLNSTPEQAGRLAQQVTRLLIDEKLRTQEVRRRRVPITDEDVAEAVADIEKRNNLPRGGLANQLRQAGVQPRALYDQLRSQIGWARLIRGTLGESAVPADAEVAEFVNAAQSRIGQPEYLASEIFIPVENPTLEAEARRFVDEVSRQLRSGTPFQVAATQFSQSQTALQGGDLGWVHKDTLDPEVAAVIERMPPGAISAGIRVPGGFQIIALRGKRETGRDLATILNLRQVMLPFSTPLSPQTPPTEQQRAQVERAQRLAESARGCDAMDAAHRQSGSARNPDPGPVRLETVNPPQLRQMLAALVPGRASQPLLSSEGIMLFMLCSKETRNLAEITAPQAKDQMLRDRIESQSRTLLRDVRRRANIEMRDNG